MRRELLQREGEVLRRRKAFRILGKTGLGGRPALLETRKVPERRVIRGGFSLGILRRCSRGTPAIPPCSPEVDRVGCCGGGTCVANLSFVALLCAFCRA
jgi:hypothetical protein